MYGPAMSDNSYVAGVMIGSSVHPRSCTVLNYMLLLCQNVFVHIDLPYHLCGC